jgi:hypothetical protein
MKRLPRRQKFAGYTVEILLVSQSVLREEMGDEDGECLYEGGWFPDLDADRVHGRILILQSLPWTKKWFVFWHECLHAVNDIRDWDMETKPIQ